MGRRTPAPDGGTGVSTTERQLVGLNVVRQWARRHELPVGTRGHIAQSIIDRYNRYHRLTQAVNKNPMTTRDWSEE